MSRFLVHNLVTRTIHTQPHFSRCLEAAHRRPLAARASQHHQPLTHHRWFSSVFALSGAAVVDHEGGAPAGSWSAAGADMAVPAGITFYRSLTISPLPRARGCDRIEVRIRTDLDVCQLMWQDGVKFVHMVRDIDSFMLEELHDPSYHLEFLTDGHSDQIRQAQRGRHRQPQLGFRAQVAYNNPSLRPPKPRKACISCDSDNPISALSFYGQSDKCNVWLDGKARANTPFIVTPFRHLDSLAEMTDEEVLDMYRQASLTILKSPADPAELAASAAVAQLSFWASEGEISAACAAAAEADPRLAASPQSSSPSPSATAICPQFFQPHVLILNQGNFRNLAHIHLKVRLPPNIFLQVRKSWKPRMFWCWSQLEDLSSDKGLMGDYVGGGAVSTPKLEIPAEVREVFFQFQQENHSQQKSVQPQQQQQQ